MSTSRRRVELSTTAYGFAAIILAGALWVIPAASRNPLLETSVWSALCLTAFVGWGSVVRQVVARGERIDLGLRAIWGLGLVCFLGGLLMVPALMTRTTAFVLVELGLVGACISLIVERQDVGRSVHRLFGLSRREPAIADWHTNPYDDDIAYLAFAKKLSDTGTILEPFSFRRLSAYGGQTLFLEIVGVRAAPSQANTFDRAVCFVIVVALLFGYRRRGRRPGWLALVALTVMLATLPSIAINTGSYWSGVAVFLGLYRTLVWAEARDRRALHDALPLALLAAAACTLRQNFLAIPVLVLGISYAIRFVRTKAPLGQRLLEPLLLGALVLGFIAPWMIVSWQSCRTILFPVLPGTFNKALALNASDWNLVREIAFQCDTALQGLPLKTLPFFLLAIFFTRDKTPRAPLMSVALGSVGGLWVLVHSLTQSDAQNIGRYAFGFMIPVAVAVALHASSERLRGRWERVAVAMGLALFATMAQLVSSHVELPRDWTLKFHNIENLAYSAPRSIESDPREVSLYARLQAAVPPGERIAVLVDEPYFLNFGRNPIWNLDMPGYASLPPGMPFFQGSGALEEYLRKIGVRWFMFVIPDASRYHYRREYFLELFINEQEIWRSYAPYLVDFLNSEVELAGRHHKVRSERGIVVLDLGAPRGTTEPPDDVESFATKLRAPAVVVDAGGAEPASSGDAGSGQGPNGSKR